MLSYVEVHQSSLYLGDENARHLQDCPVMCQQYLMDL